MSVELVVVGDAFLDRDVVGEVERLCPEAPVPVLDERDTTSRPGGAGLAALLAADRACNVTLVTALGDDDAGAEVRRSLEPRGVRIADLGLDGATPEKVRLRCDGRTLIRLDRGSAGLGRIALAAAEVPAMRRADAVLVADYGLGITSQRCPKPADLDRSRVC